MSVRESKGYKIALWSLSLVFLGGAGYLGYRTFFASGSTARQAKAAEGAFARGTAAYGAKNWGEAATRFDEANLLADKAMDAWKEQVEAKKIPQEEALALRGQILWVKARALRDQAYAKAQADGKPLPEPADPQYNETFRTFAAISDAEAQTAARNSLRGAYVSTAADAELNKQVLKELLRFELVLTPIDWKFVEPALRKAVELSPDEARANYYLARHEYEQPDEATGAPAALARRTAERMDKARDHLAAARRGKAPFWRTTGLEVEILDWPVRTATARKLKPEALAAAERAVDARLFDAGGAVEAAARGEHLAGAGAADVVGLTSVLTVGAERGAAAARAPGGSPDRLRQVVRAALAAAGKVADDPAVQPTLRDFVPAVAEIVAGAQPLLAKGDPAGWTEITAGLDALLAKSPDAAKNGPRVRLARARLATADALAAADPAKAKELLARAVKELEDGLKAAEAAKAAPVVLDELHADLLERKFAQGTKVEELEPHLARLRASALPRAKQVGAFYDGMVAERQGRLDKARRQFEPLAADRANPDLAFQAAVQIANVATATGDWAAALGALKDVEARYGSAGLPAAARAWADERLGGADGLAAALVGANLQVAAAAAGKFARENPGKPVPGELVAGYETAAEGLAKRLKAGTAPDRVARLALAGYQLATGRKKDAAARLEALALDYPDSVEVLRARCVAVAAPEPGAAPDPNAALAADGLIRAFLKATADSPQANRAGKLFNAEWLLRTNRADKAVEYLNAPDTFPGGRDATVDRLLAAALLRTGQTGEAQKVLGRLPPDPAVEAVLIQAAGAHAAGDRLKAAIGRYEDQGLLRVYEAAALMADGKYEEAARGFASAAEFTRYGAAARAGLRQALLALAETDPAKGRDAAVSYAAERPDEPGVYLAAALAARLSDDVGSPDDKWGAAKTMYAAVNRWEEAAVKAGMRPADAVAVRTQFRVLAGDVAGARQVAAAGRNRDPKSVNLMLLSAELALEAPADPERAREFLAAATAESANDPRLPFLEAAIKLAENKPAEAAAVYERLAGEQPRNPGVRAQLVAALEAAGKKDDALARAQDWHKTFPADGRAAATVVRLLAGANKRDEAVKAADAFVAERVAEARKQLAAANPPLPAAEAEKRADGVRAAALMAAAGGFFRAGAHADAEARVREAAKLLPDADAPALMLGDLALAKKDWAAAEAAYAGILKRNPRHFVAGNNLAWLLAAERNDPEKALALVTEVRKARGGDRPVGPERLPADFLDTIGLVYTKLPPTPDRAAEMRALFEAAARRYPTDPRMRLFLGHALAATGDRSKALEAYREAVRLARLKNGLPDDQNKSAREQAEASEKKLRG